MENKAVRYDRIISERKDDELGLFEKYDEILETVRKIITESKAESVLDIGCGTGNLCGPLSDSIEVVGLDQNEEMLNRAKEKFPKMSIRKGSFKDKPYVENYFDVVATSLAFHGIEHEEKIEVLKNMLGYLKKNGKLIIADFMFSSRDEKEKYKREYLAQGKQELWDAVNRKYYTYADELVKYIESIGYKIEINHIVNFTWIAVINR